MTEDSIVYNVLCWHNTHTMAWEPYTPEQLTIKFGDLNYKYKAQTKKVGNLEAKIIELMVKLQDKDDELNQLESTLQEME